MLAPESVQDAEAPALEVREHAVDPLEDFMRGRVSDRDHRAVLQPVAAGPAVGRDPGSRSGRIFEERLQRRAGLVRDPAELGASWTVLPEHLDRSGVQADLQFPKPGWCWSRKADIPFECEVMMWRARCQLLSGTCERCMNVPAAAEVCFLQSRHWWTQRGRLSRTAFLLPQSGQTKPSGQRRRKRSSAQASSSGNIRSNRSDAADSSKQAILHNGCGPYFLVKSALRFHARSGFGVQMVAKAAFEVQHGSVPPPKQPSRFSSCNMTIFSSLITRLPPSAKKSDGILDCFRSGGHAPRNEFAAP